MKTSRSTYLSYYGGTEPVLLGPGFVSYVNQRNSSYNPDFEGLLMSNGDLTFDVLMEEIDNFDGGQLVWVDVLHDVFSLLPPNQEMLLTHIEMNQKDGKLTLKTKAKDRETATDVIRKLEEFQREGRDRPRFKAGMGPQTEKKKDRYPFTQDLRVTVLDDGPGSEERTQGSSRD